MARLLITSAGSLGDLFPYASLAQHLQAQGHQVIFAVERRFATWLADRGFTAQVLNGDIIATYLEVAPHLPVTTNALTSIKLLLDHYLLPTLPRRVEELIPLCEQADLLITSTVQLAGAIAAEVTQTPYVSIALTPASIPDPALAPTPYWWPLPRTVQRLLNRMGWTAGRWALRQLADQPINQIRHRWGLSPKQDYLLEGGVSPRLTAVAISPAILPPDLRWPAHIQATGFCFWEEDWEEPAEVMTLLADPAPVVAVAL